MALGQPILARLEAHHVLNHQFNVCVYSDNQDEATRLLILFVALHWTLRFHQLKVSGFDPLIGEYEPESRHRARPTFDLGWRRLGNVRRYAAEIVSYDDSLRSVLETSIRVSARFLAHSLVYAAPCRHGPYSPHEALTYRILSRAQVRDISPPLFSTQQERGSIPQ